LETGPCRLEANVLATIQLLLENTVRYKLIITHAVIDIPQGSFRDLFSAVLKKKQKQKHKQNKNNKTNKQTNKQNQKRKQTNRKRK